MAGERKVWWLHRVHWKNLSTCPGWVSQKNSMSAELQTDTLQTDTTSAFTKAAQISSHILLPTAQQNEVCCLRSFRNTPFLYWKKVGEHSTFLSLYSRGIFIGSTVRLFIATTNAVLFGIKNENKALSSLEISCQKNKTHHPNFSPVRHV